MGRPITTPKMAFPHVVKLEYFLSAHYRVLSRMALSGVLIVGILC
jgi:hypothetical protein